MYSTLLQDVHIHVESDVWKDILADGQRQTEIHFHLTCSNNIQNNPFIKF